MTEAFGLNAKRFAGKPMKQPLYHFSNVEKCQRNLSGSSIQLVEKREDFVEYMAELVLLCNSAMQRAEAGKKNGKKTSKPLSLESIADRLDVDDPIWGYMVRDSTSQLQGFITCTTFTNWQSTFRWDSVHDSAFAYDDDQTAQQMMDGTRKFDKDGSLAAELQATVRCGDPWNEGIVWPRIAEISLLGGLGCGKTILSLLLEKLEGMKATANQNYDYAVLQATENSIPFYESMGFVRVGCITVDKDFEKTRRKRKLSVGSSSSTESGDQSVVVLNEPASPDDDGASTPQIVSSAVTTYEVLRAGETVLDIAKKLNVCPLDVVFLNQYIYDQLTQRSYLMKGTKLFIPSGTAKRISISLVSNKSELSPDSDVPHWYIAKENDTPRMIAKKFQLQCDELVEANKERLPELISISRLKEGTRIKVSHFHIHDDQHVPYCHWTFPDDSFEQNEPSYMMARRLKRSTRSQANLRPVEKSLAVPVTKFVRPPNSLYATETRVDKPLLKTPIKIAGLPQKPKRPASGYILFCNEHRPNVTKSGLSAAALSKILASKWKTLSDEEKAPYESRYEEERVKYQKALEKYEEDLEAFGIAHPELSPSHGKGVETAGNTLFNEVVRLNPGAIPDSHAGFTYFYVLTYIPDLQWCHLAPMQNAGKWGPEKPRAEGRPIWMLVDESEGMELDISASFCVPVASKAMKQTLDADEEQWDIFESGSGKAIIETNGIAAFKTMFTNRASNCLEEKKKDAPKVTTKVQSRSATKPLSGTIERKRKRSRSVDAKKEGESKTHGKVVKAESSETDEKCPTGACHSLCLGTATQVSLKPLFPRTQLPKNSGKQPSKEKAVMNKNRPIGPEKETPIKNVKGGESPSLSSHALAESTRFRGVYRELPHRRAAPNFFEEPLPTPKKKSRKDSQPPSGSSKGLDESPRFRGVYRELPHRRAAPIFSCSDPHPRTVKNVESQKIKSVGEFITTAHTNVRRELPRRKAAPDLDVMAQKGRNARSVPSKFIAANPLSLSSKRGLRDS